MMIPSSTYRIQFSSQFTLEDLQENLMYLKDLGISTVYASPIFQAREGSTHGYDVLDPYTINKEIGTLESFRLISETLRQQGMSWLQDIVPNHMAFDGKNPWLRDIFELGPESEHYRFFDIDWEESGKVMAPFLGAPLEEVLEKNELKLEFHRDRLSWDYYDQTFPASARSYSKVLEKAGVGNWLAKFQNFSGNDMQWEDLRIGFFREVQEDPELRDGLNAALEEINSSSEELKAVLDLQYFRLAYWKDTEKEINYRRFFTINGLICLRAEDQTVLESYHYYLKELCEQDLITGLRIDHIDGLFDPAGYLRNLIKFMGTEPFLVVEKIQESEEDLPSDWPVQGSTGYEFLAQVNQLFTQADNEGEFSAFYKELVPELPEYRNLVYQKKLYILKENMGGELDNLCQLLEKHELLPGEGAVEENTREALAIFMASFPVYRIYPESFPLEEDQKKIIEKAYEEAVRNASDKENELAILKSLLLGEAGKDAASMLYFLQRCQQFTGPLAAKGVEDTVFYIYNRLISHNEVGDSAGIFGMSIASFHDKMQKRQEKFPLSLNATATHDTKRGEDARMRINVLSELPEEWFEKVRQWQTQNEPLKNIPNIPDANEEYFIYQSLLGGFPFGEAQNEDFVLRIREYLQKALREAKVHSDWAQPDEEYEAAVFKFVETILGNADFMGSFKPFQEKVAYYGALKSLGQTLLKITAPGIPDVYQGTELWDLSFVDPDNRRPVNYADRKTLLTEYKEISTSDLKSVLNGLKEDFSDGKIKLYLLNRALDIRKEHRELFEKGEYLPLEVRGESAEKVIAYGRRLGDIWAMVIIPVLVTSLFDPDTFEPNKDNLSDSAVLLPEDAPQEWRNCLTGMEFRANGHLNLQDLLQDFPVALLIKNS